MAAAVFWERREGRKVCLPSCPANNWEKSYKKYMIWSPIHSGFQTNWSGGVFSSGAIASQWLTYYKYVHTIHIYVRNDWLFTQRLFLGLKGGKSWARHRKKTWYAEILLKATGQLAGLLFFTVTNQLTRQKVVSHHPPLGFGQSAADAGQPNLLTANQLARWTAGRGSTTNLEQKQSEKEEKNKNKQSRIRTE